ncbi:MAG TPA: carbohydrate ABC transporter permease [Naasia sp.]|jgi:multiple sugar transport system permease protein
MSAEAAPAAVAARPARRPRRRRRRPRLRQVIGFLAAAVALFPVFWLIVSALRPAADVFEVGLPDRLTLDNFRYVLTDVPFPRYLFNSFVVAGTVTVVALWFHSMAGYALARLRFPGRELVFAAVVATLLIAQSVILVPLFLLVRELGWVDSYAGLIIPSIFNAFGIFWLRQFYLGIPRELEDAARVDGAGYWRIYWHVALPLSRPVLASLAVLFFLVNWNAYLWPLTVTRDADLWVVQVGMATLQSQYSAAWNYVCAGAVIAAIPTIVLFLLFQRRITDAIKTSGLK